MKIRVAGSFFLSLSLLLVGCSDGRPDAEQARLEFEKLYPEVELIEVKNSEDEVVACSFEFTYRLPDSKENQRIELQFMESSNGDWEFTPDPPQKLP